VSPPRHIVRADKNAARATKQIYFGPFVLMAPPLVADELPSLGRIVSLSYERWFGTAHEL